MTRADRAILLSKIPLWMLTVASRAISLFNLPFSRYPLYRKGCLVHQPVLILGCGRSGNTLLRSMLAAGGEIAIPPESYVLPKTIRLFKAYNYLPWEQLSGLIVSEFQAYKEFYTWRLDLSSCHSECRLLPKRQQTLANIIDVIYRHYARENGVESEYWGDKTPINALYVQHMIKLFPDARFIHLIRDPRAVVASYIKAGMHSDICSVAKLWKTINNRLGRNLKPNMDSLIISYEELVQNPEETLQKTARHIGISYSEDLLNHHLWSRELGDVSAHRHHENVTRPLTTLSLDAWQKLLSESEILSISQVVAGAFGSERYELR